MSSDFRSLIEKAYKDDVYFGVPKVQCWDTGVYALNRALGGGIPSGRMSLFVGKESTSKCLTADTYIYTADGGYKTIAEIFKENGVALSNEPKETRKKIRLVNREGEAEEADYFVCNGIRKIRKLITKSGAVSKSTHNHPLLTITEKGELEWKYTKDFQKGDYLVGLRNPEFFGTIQIAPDEAYALGLLIADGGFQRSRIGITNDDPDIKDFVEKKLVDILNTSYKCYENNTEGSVNYHFNSLEKVGEFYSKHDLTPCNSKDKHIPNNVMAGTKETILHFLAGYLDSESHNCGRTLLVSSASYQLLQQVKLLLSQLGVSATLTEIPVAEYPDNDYWSLLVSGLDYKHLMVEYLLEYSRSNKFKQAFDTLCKFRNEDWLPHTQDIIMEIYGEATNRSRESWKLVSGIQKGGNISEPTLDKLLAVLTISETGEQRVEHLNKLRKYTFDKIVEIEDVEDAPTFDFSVPNTNSFVAGGLINHNTTCAIKTAANVASTNRKTGKRCDPSDPDSCNVLFLDQEGALDVEWCKINGYYPNDHGNLTITANTGNQAIDIISAAFQSREFSLIILDSIEACHPHKDLEKSSEDFMVGSRARMMNDAYRRWQVAISEAAHNVDHWWQRPTFLGINQLRDAISLMPSSPVIPAGIGQRQFSSVIVQFNTPKYSDTSKLGGRGTFKGVVKKNKVAPPRIGFEFDMCLKGSEEEPLGYVDNVKSIIQDVRRFNLWQKDGKDWELFGHKMGKQTDFSDKMRAEPDFELEIMHNVIEALK